MPFAVLKFSRLNGSEESFLSPHFCDLMTLQRLISCPTSVSITYSIEIFSKDSMAKHLHYLY